ncbi:MAG: hypothetical protein DI569_13015 [Sphingopyxis macrogoltabida]|uniref:Uncharacterized protein n=1 Tax=Sphingopyxis macrogoltabida TaxID=33050 RepID=A0A2W5L0V3_SPHMC|nr:MAG: hypothetical protein DI569_13015 [Sphingopyxis macrogoltabida]
MIGRVRSFIAANALAIMGGFTAVAIGVAAIQSVQLHGLKIGPIAIEGCRDKASRFEAQAKAAAETVAQSEGLRAQEQVQDRQSYSAQSYACDDRVTIAREAAHTIAEVTKVADTPHSSAAGSIIGAGSLRRIIGQDTGAEAAGLPARIVAAAPDGTGVAR